VNCYNQSLEGDLNIPLAGNLLEAQPAWWCLHAAPRDFVLAMGRAESGGWSPQVTCAVSVGAGDATLAGLLWGVAEKCDPDTLARRAVAVAQRPHAGRQRASGSPRCCRNCWIK